MKKFFKFSAIAVILNILLLSVSAKSETSTFGVDSPEKLYGIKRVIAVIDHDGGSDGLAAATMKVDGDKLYYQHVVDKAVSDLFSQKEIIHTVPYWDALQGPKSDWKDTVQLNFGFSVRQERVGLRSVTLGALSIALKGFLKDGHSDDIAFTVPRSYAFVLPDDPEDTANKVVEAVNFLTRGLPQFIEGYIRGDRKSQLTEEQICTKCFEMTVYKNSLQKACKQ